MNHAIIQTEGLRFAYAEEGAVNPFVLDGVSLDIEEGSFVAVLGHNGSGKSTLAKLLNAILLPSGGKVYVDGIDTADEDKLLDIRRTVGMVFQNPDNQIVANVVEEDVPSPLRIWECPRRRSAGGWTTPSRPWVCTSTGSTPPTCSPADRNSGWPLPVSSLWRPAALCWTSPPPCWTPSVGRRS